MGVESVGMSKRKRRTEGKTSDRIPPGRRGDGKREGIQDAVTCGSALPDHQLALEVGDDSFSRVGSWSPVVCRKPVLWNLNVVRECRPRAALCASVSSCA